MTIEQLVRDFHNKYNCFSQTRPKHVPDEIRDVRIRLLREEVDELIEAMEYGRLSDIAKEIGDVVYVAVGIAIAYGLPFSKVFLKVHRSNMTKTGEKFNGKITKGSDYVPPDLSELDGD